MRQKELRIALVCYGGVSLAVYMHGVTKELWKLARASRAYHGHEEPSGPVEAVWQRWFGYIESERGLRLRVLPDILTGASAGGINAVFLAQAIHSGQSLEPLTELWLENADVEELIDPEARPWSKAAKFWFMPAVLYMLRQPESGVSESVAPETRAEVRRKVSHLVRGRWFEPPFSGPHFSRLIHNALEAMAAAPASKPLLPPGHPLDLVVTATDFRGHRELLRMNSPPVVEESEHRMPIGFRKRTPALPGENLAERCELTFAARATASFPGAFPPLRVAEIDGLVEDTAPARGWPGRAAFLRRIMPSHVDQGTCEQVSLIDGSVLVNAPFRSAINALPARPAQREVDRRVAYIDPRPDRVSALQRDITRPVGFFSAIFGSLSTIPREQPIRDNLEQLERQSREAARLRQMVHTLRPEIEAVVDKLFGYTLFLDRPTPKRLASWRAKAQQAAAEQAGYAFQSYAQAKMALVVEQLARLLCAGLGEAGGADVEEISARIRMELDRRGLASLASDKGGGASEEAIAFLRTHDLAFRIRRLRLIARRLSRDWEADPEFDDEGLEEARDAIYRALALYFEHESAETLGPDFAAIAESAMDKPGEALDWLASARDLAKSDLAAEQILADALEAMPQNLRRRVLMAYLGFPFYDVATLPLLRNEGLTEFDTVKVDRISPEDARSIRPGGTSATLRGTEFYNFGGFFSRAYRENDYLWGRLHGAERMIDLVCSTLPERLATSAVARFKRELFLAICDEEAERALCDARLVDGLRAEIEEKLGSD
ncbi:patatin-like protein [Aurantiacibacter xanthus]|uniref:Patatin-like protein n=1 Tax=Aurantiacibacter xanthus TaxID=1784712 RepID=A0A3A1PFS3_9SPHN|nr:patatin-like protein [Aurantiacibacter xanthus]RIV91905.1 patatin-like protein [Aurantiacibacter xanthus]